METDVTDGVFRGIYYETIHQNTISLIVKIVFTKKYFDLIRYGILFCWHG